MTRTHLERPLIGAGLIGWAAAGLPQMVAWASGRGRFEQNAVVWCAAYGAFAIAFQFAVRKGLGRAWRRLALAVQSFAALIALAIGHTGFEGVLLCVVAGEGPLVVGEKKGFVWVLAQTAGMVVVDLVSPYRGPRTYLSAFAYAGFQLFAFGASRLVEREAQARIDLGRVNAELLATRELFADSTRSAERLRIARELHDSLGHHLTALTLQLELARNSAGGQHQAALDHAHALSRELLVPRPASPFRDKFVDFWVKMEIIRGADGLKGSAARTPRSASSPQRNVSSRAREHGSSSSRAARHGVAFSDDSYASKRSWASLDRSHARRFGSGCTQMATAMGGSTPTAVASGCR